MQTTIDSTKNVSISTKAKVDTNLELTNQIQKLSALNIEIAKNIVTLTTLNNKIASSTQTFAKDGKTLIKQNLASTSNLNNLTENAKFLLDKIYDEQIGGNSIPLVYATTLKDVPIPEGDGFTWDTGRHTNKYLDLLELANTGDYKLSEITVTKFERRYRAFTDYTKLFEGNLNAREPRRLLVTVIDTLKFPPTEPSEQEPDLNYYFTEKSEWGWGIAVHWRNISHDYTYEYGGNGTNEITIKHDYFYHGKHFYKPEDLLNDFMMERKSEKEQRKKLIPNK